MRTISPNQDDSTFGYLFGQTHSHRVTTGSVTTGGSSVARYGGRIRIAVSQWIEGVENGRLPRDKKKEFRNTGIFLDATLPGSTLLIAWTMHAAGVGTFKIDGENLLPLNDGGITGFPTVIQMLYIPVLYSHDGFHG